MKRILMTIILCTSSISALHAADMTMETTGMYDWSGIFVGVQGGGGWGNSHVDDNGLTSLDEELDIDGGFLGGVVGAQWQNGSFVYGVEAEINWSNISGNEEIQLGNFIGTEIDWFGSVNGRLGYAWDRVLLYGTAGVAFAGIETNQQLAPDSFAETESHVGWTIGAGVDYALTENLFLGAQYRYYDFGSEDYTPSDPIFTVREQDVDMHTVSLHLGYKF
ncbi:MAG: porin [Rhizobiales bacterium]|nr:porin [Hyphomicrobiales bacterium]MBA68378.1 porin [Hyphomicrobiales bacterium]